MIDIGRTAGATGRQGMLTPPWHLIPPLVFPGVCVTLFLLWLIPLPELMSVHMIRHTDIDSGLFRLHNLDTLILTTEFYE